jgi:hypothetical protein
MGGKNICDCPAPPGGQAMCESHQLAICRVQNGVASTMCLDPPVRADGQRVAGTQLENWILGRVTGITRSLGSAISASDRLILDSGYFVDPQSGVEVTFLRPRAEGTSTPSGMAAPPALGA